MFKDLNKNWLLPCLFIFFLSLLPRYFIIKHTPESDKHTDLQIYINGGLLITNHVNPYDFNDKKDVREKLRSNPKLNEPWLMGSEVKWNFYTSGNLPASLLFYGAVEGVADGDPVTYRLIFAIIDSILAVLVFLFVVQFWGIDSAYLKFGVAILLGALNPVLLYWGGLIPEDKGLQIALMVASLLFARHNKLVWSALFMGLAISFKGLGVFHLPLCLYYICNSPTSLKGFISRASLLQILKYGIVSSLAFGIFFVPFLPEVLGMMWTRLSSNLSGPPEHSSIWTIPFHLWPSNWMVLRTTFIIFFLSLVVYGSFKKRFDFEIVSACILIFFVDISLNMGSLDRMNIGFIVAILILGTSGFSKESLVLVSVYFVLGLAALIVYSKNLYLLEQAEKFDAVFSLSLVVLLTVLLVHHLFNTRVLVTRSGLAAITVAVVLILWNARQTAVESVVRRILLDVGLGIKTENEAKLTSEEVQIARSLISANPNNYNEAQKAIAFGVSQDKFNPDRLLYNVGMGKIDPDSISLSPSQIKIIDSIISQRPDYYNVLQKSLTTKRPEIFYAEKVLRNVGMGKLNPDSVKVSFSRQQVIDSMILAYPENYNDAQKKLLKRKAN